MDSFCYLCFVSVMLSCLFLAALWSPAGERDNLLALLCVSISHMGQVWYLIVSIPDLCILPLSSSFFHFSTCA